MGCGLVTHSAAEVFGRVGVRWSVREISVEPQPPHTSCWADGWHWVCIGRACLFSRLTNATGAAAGDASQLLSSHLHVRFSRSCCELKWSGRLGAQSPITATGGCP